MADGEPRPIFLEMFIVLFAYAYCVSDAKPGRCSASFNTFLKTGKLKSAKFIIRK